MFDHILYDVDNFLSFIGTSLIFNQEIMMLSFYLKKKEKKMVCNGYENSLRNGE